MKNLGGIDKIVRNTAEEASSGHCHEEQSSTKRKRKHTAIITESNEHEQEHTVAKKQRQGKKSPTPREKSTVVGKSKAASRAGHSRVESRSSMHAGTEMLQSLEVLSSNFPSDSAVLIMTDDTSSDNKESHQSDSSNFYANNSPEPTRHQNNELRKNDKRPAHTHILTNRQQETGVQLSDK